MGTDEALQDLLDRWEAARAAGASPSAEELCREHPELFAHVTRQIHALKAMDWLLESHTDQDLSSNEPCASRATGAGVNIEYLSPGLEPMPGYRLLSRMGRGGSGEVWKGTGPGGLPLALKFVKLTARAGAVEMHALEVIKEIRHANLLATFAAWHQDSFLIIGMELADRTLFDRFQEAKAQSLPGIPGFELLEYLSEAAKGIDFLNAARQTLEGQESAGIQHRDIKPQNLLLVGGCVKVADFGLARVLNHTVTGHTGSMTPAYAAPEFLRGQTHQRSDQYSLAVTYCLLSNYLRTLEPL